MKLENKLSAPEIQQWDIHGVPVISIPIKKKKFFFFYKKESKEGKEGKANSKSSW